MSSLPEPPFEHLLRLSDSTGIYEHARGALPRREHGYCVDDVARGLVVLSREPDPSPELLRLLERCLAFVAHAQTGTGTFHNRLGYDRRWHDAGGTGDWWGRALWGLGSVIARAKSSWVRDDAWALFAAGAVIRSPSLRSMAFAALGAAEVLSLHPDDDVARALLADAAVMIGRPHRDKAWPWPERKLFYANAILPEALIAAGHHLQDGARLADGLAMLRWLLGRETRDGHLSVVPTGGWSAHGPRPAFDQQPIEVSSIVDACARASEVDDDQLWLEGVRMGVDWFLGDNDIGKSMFDSRTGGSSDGLGVNGPSLNQGAESTLALISTFQHARLLRTGGRS